RAGSSFHMCMVSFIAGRRWRWADGSWVMRTAPLAGARTGRGAGAVSAVSAVSLAATVSPAAAGGAACAGPAGGDGAAASGSGGMRDGGSGGVILSTRGKGSESPAAGMLADGVADTAYAAGAL